MRLETVQRERTEDRPHREDHWRFQPEDHADRLRTRLGVAGLVWVGGVLLAAAARLGTAPRRVMERLWSSAAMRHLDLNVRWKGLEHVDPSVTYLVASLHEGFADAIPLMRLPLDLRFVVRDELFSQPPLGTYLRAAHHIAVPTYPDRRDLKRILAEVEEAFSRDESVVVFPQGTILGIETAFRAGAWRLARHFRRPLLPIVMSGSHRVWEHPFSPTLRYHQTMTLEVFEPLDPNEIGPVSMRSLERRMKAKAMRSPTPTRRFVPERDGWWDDYDYEIDPDFPELVHALAAHRSIQLSAATD